MGPLRHAAAAIARRPSIICFAGAAAFVFCLANRYNPVVPVLTGLNRATGGDIFDNMISFLQIIMEPRAFNAMLPLLPFILLAVSLASGLILSGYFNIVNNALEEKQRTRREFADGLKKYFAGIAGTTFTVVLGGTVLLIFLMVASVPAVIITKSALANKPDLLIGAVLVDIVTACVIFFAVMFFKAYTFFWYPALYFCRKKAFRTGKHLVDRHFWTIAVRYLIFDIVFLAAMFLIKQISNPFVLFAAGWILASVFFALFTVYVFSLFKDLKMKTS